MARALLIVDFQNDFTPGGALAVRDGDAIAGRIDELARAGDYELVVATRDWHPPDHGSFAAQGGPWPEHCVQGSQGAELHPALDRALVDVVVDKGQDPATEGYSGFEATGLAELLRERGIDDVTVVGLATDYCVKNTALDALRNGFGVTVDATAVRAVDVQPGDGQRALDEVRAAGGSVAKTARVNISDPEFAYAANDPEGFRAGMFRCGPQLGAQRTGASVYELPPGQAVCPYHYEYGEEEWVLVLEGRPSLRTPAGTEQLAPFDLAFFPRGPDGAHQLRNDSDSTARIVMWSEVVTPSVTVYPDSDKLGIWTGEKADDMLVERSSKVDYFHGEGG